MLKRLYTRFLLWALGPVLVPAPDDVGGVQAQALVINGRVTALNQVMISASALKCCQLADA